MDDNTHVYNSIYFKSKEQSNHNRSESNIKFNVFVKHGDFTVHAFEHFRDTLEFEVPGFI